MKATKDHLRRPRVEHGTVTLADGSEVEIRPLSRKKALKVHELQQSQGMEASEALLLHMGMVDPAMPLDEVLEWMDDDGAAGDIQAVSRGIGVISGMVEGSGKEAWKSAGG
jgi:hypothetical protein